MTPANWIEIITIVLALLSIIVTTIGFFASLRFYQDGMSLQKQANDAMVRVEEKALSIQTQVEGMFNKTLDAALNKQNTIDNSFDTLNEQFEIAMKTIVEQAQQKVGESTADERKRLEEIANKQLSNIEKTLNSTWGIVDSAISTGATEYIPTMFTDYHGDTLNTLYQNPASMTARQVAKEINVGHITTQRYLRDLISAGYVLADKAIPEGENDQIRYKLTEAGIKYCNEH